MSNFVNNDGIWFSRTSREVSYPEDGNISCYQIEDESFWFENRNLLIEQALLENYSERWDKPSRFLDCGGGNGYVAKMIQDLGFETFLAEPGNGVFNAKKRGITNVYKCVIEDLPGDLIFDIIGFFDVLEHVENPRVLLREAAARLHEKGLLLLTVPAYQSFFSEDDELAGHFRRYSAAEISSLLNDTGFKVNHISYFFSFLLLPILFLRVIPYRLGFRKGSDLLQTGTVKRDHAPSLVIRKILNGICAIERFWIRKFNRLPFGSSIIVVASKR